MTAVPSLPSMRTRVTELFGIRFPIIQGGMQWVGRAELAAAVSNAGGLGILTGLTQSTPDALAKEIDRCRTMTQEPFAVNMTIFPTITSPPYRAYIDAIVAGGVKIVETAGVRSQEFWPAMRAAGIKIIHKCVAVRHAVAAQRMGVDAISIDGFECAGHPGEEDVPGLILIPLAASALDVPVIASGGIGDGRGLAAALALGADGVNMGTRFQLTQEAPIHDNVKRALLLGSERDTRLIFRTLRNTDRVFRNKISAQVVAAESAGCEFADIRHLVAGERGRKALESGDPEDGIISTGLVIGLIDDIPTCDQLIQRMVAECRERLGAAQSAFSL
jgi:NADH:quinone reductase (non-electrogenic)